jgi:hypothetical protein
MPSNPSKKLSVASPTSGKRAHSFHHRSASGRVLRIGDDSGSTLRGSRRAYVRRNRRMTGWIDQLMSLWGKARPSPRSHGSFVSTRPRQHPIPADAVGVPRPSPSPEIDKRTNEATAPARFGVGPRSEGAQKGKSPSPSTDALFGSARRVCA